MLARYLKEESKLTRLTILTDMFNFMINISNPMIIRKEDLYGITATT